MESRRIYLSDISVNYVCVCECNAPPSNILESSQERLIAENPKGFQ